MYIIYPPNFLHRHCFIVSWDFQYYCCPKRSKDNSYVKFLGVNNVYYGVLKTANTYICLNLAKCSQGTVKWPLSLLALASPPLLAT